MLAFNLTANNFWLLLAGNLTVQPDQNFGLRRQTNNFFEKIMTTIFFCQNASTEKNCSMAFKVLEQLNLTNFLSV